MTFKTAFQRWYSTTFKFPLIEIQKLKHDSSDNVRCHFRSYFHNNLNVRCHYLGKSFDYRKHKIIPFQSLKTYPLGVALPNIVFFKKKKRLLCMIASKSLVANMSAIENSSESTVGYLGVIGHDLLGLLS